jgi:hypothetical protein
MTGQKMLLSGRLNNPPRSRRVPLPIVSPPASTKPAAAVFTLAKVPLTASTTSSVECIQLRISGRGAIPRQEVARSMSTTPNRETINDTAKLIMHRLIARELVRNPSLVARARTSLEKMAARFPDRPFVREWDTLLGCPVNEIVAILRGRDEDARRLRLSSPFVLAEGIDFRDEALRRRIGRAAKRLAAHGSAVT